MMPFRYHFGSRLAVDRAFVLLIPLLILYWFAGGASRGDVPGQILVRGGACGALLAASLWMPRPAWRTVRPVAAFLLIALILVILQLVPLPPAVWQSLPSRAWLADAAIVSGQPQPWRPLSLVPGATMNAAESLVVPAAVLVLIAGMRERTRAMLPALVLVLVAAGAGVGMLQAIGAGFGNPLINDTPGEVSGMFANRNHFALFLAMGCLIAPVWAFDGTHAARWRSPVAFALVLLFVLTILASGSRAGMMIGGVATGIGLLLARRGLARMLRHVPRWVVPALLVSIVGMIGGLVLVALLADRAESINRILSVDASDDMRARALPVVLKMVRTYFPLGTGIGGFDTMFRIYEPFDLLKPTYFNHAHNDFFEIVLDAGLPGLLAVTAAVLWWGWASVRGWRIWRATSFTLPLLGSATILLILIASIFDYPARTPMIMAMLAIAATWLNAQESEGAAYPP